MNAVRHALAVEDVTDGGRVWVQRGGVDGDSIRQLEKVVPQRGGGNGAMAMISILGTGSNDIFLWGGQLVLCGVAA